MSDPRTAASRRLLARVLRRAELTESGPPDHAGWTAFLGLIRSLLADQEQERYLLERSLENSSREMRSLYESLRASAEELAAEHRELRAANSVLEATLESTADGIVVVGADGAISSFNTRFVEMWSIPEELLRSRDDADALSFVVGQLRDPNAFTSAVEAISGAATEAVHDTLESKDGRVFKRVSLPQKLDGEIIGRVWSFRDITAETQLTSQLQHRALHDSLTGLANRAAFDDHLIQALRRQARHGGSLAVIVVDLDGFKHINDSLGHQCGDAVLVAVAQRFRAAFRDVDTIARLGGDEFAFLIDDVASPEQAARIGQRLLDLMVEPIEFGARRVALGASIGITIAAGDTAEPERVLGQADAAMYRAKQSGKARCQLFESSMHTRAVERLSLEQSLRAAVNGGELTLHYQPVVHACTGRIASFEALSRWHHALQGFIPADTFIPLAEETGLIHDIGRSTLLGACHQAQAWRSEQPDTRIGITVNVSGRQLLEPTFARTVQEILTTTGLDPHALTLEITESILATGAGHVIGALNTLRRQGVRVAIDDFGTGYSSFAALADLPVDTLKIDKRFVDSMLHDTRRHGLVTAIIGIARTLGLSTVAEGAERPEQRDALVALGCEYIQGYLFAEPMPPDRALDYIRRQSPVHQVGHRVG